MGGTGVVPAIAMSRAARHAGRPDLVRIAAVGNSPDKLPYNDELKKFGATMTYTRHDTGLRPPGPPTADELAPLLEGIKLAYVCGSSRFAGLAEALLIECGLRRDAIRVEQFGPTV